MTTCTHDGERTERTAHGKLGDAPAGTIETLCADCGTVLKVEEPAPDAHLEAAYDDRFEVDA